MKSKIKITFYFIFCISILCNKVFSQTQITGSVIDKKSKEQLIGANILIKEENYGTTTDLNGLFNLNINQIPCKIECSYIGYKNQVIEIKNTQNNIVIELLKDEMILSDINVVDTRLSEKLKQSAVTIEAMDVIAIKETPSASFYDGLGALKGVDLTSASLGFKIINTRGFNSTSPVRSLQIIDGVDNQSPGLNFSLGNFLGTTELDTKGVEIIVGANSALYGPNAFNGVISMSTKDPFIFPGTSYQIKMGERSLIEQCFRYAENKKLNNNIEIGYKINIQRMTANDWEVDNLDPSYQTDSPINNPGGYDAVNIYGDEYNRSYSFQSKPGMGTVHRTGYLENDLVDYNTKNLKFNTAFHLKNKKNQELIYSFNYGNGTTVYQGDNRYNLKNIHFWQNKLEFKNNKDFFIRLYTTHEDAGDSYDAVATAQALVDRANTNQDWYVAYGTFWSQEIMNLMEQDLVEQGYIPQGEWIANGGDIGSWIVLTQEILNSNPELLNNYHELAREYTDNLVGNYGSSFVQPGTEEFNTLFNDITTQTRYDEYGNFIGGTKFYDKSSLYHIQAEKKLTFESNNPIELTIGANARLYKPDSRGSIFNDGYIYNDYIVTDQDGNPIIDSIIELSLNIFGQWDTTYTTTERMAIDTVKNRIQNHEFGIYIGYNQKLLSETLTLNTTARLDKNQNFDYLFSPATSIVYKPNERDIIRFSLSSAIRNPTLTDQYLDYNAGPAILLGNLNGYGFDEYFVNTDSLLSYLRGENALGAYNQSALRGSFIKVDPIKPEQVRTAEIGFRTTLFNKIYLDASYYYSIYTNFIGYQIGASYASGSANPRIATQEDIDEGWAEYIGQEIDDYLTVALPSIKVYRVAANATEKVTTQGFSIGLNYYMNEQTAINGNYSWNKLINEETKDPLVPAYNTPEHKFNIGISNKFSLKRSNTKEYSFSINYKWIQGFLFEGSPQFTGNIPSYGMIDTQLNRSIELNKKSKWENKIKLTGKIGISNLLNNQVYQAYGGPRVGRLSYLSLTFDI